jgi:hypothetical protein
VVDAVEAPDRNQRSFKLNSERAKSQWDHRRLWKSRGWRHQPAIFRERSHNASCGSQKVVLLIRGADSAETAADQWIFRCDRCIEVCCAAKPDLCSYCSAQHLFALAATAMQFSPNRPFNRVSELVEAKPPLRAASSIETRTNRT